MHRSTDFMQPMAVQAWHRQDFKRLLLLVFIFALNVSHAESIDDPALPPGLFYPFGADVGDAAVTQGDDISIGPVALSSDFVLHNKTYSQLYISDNGFISFNPNVLWYTPRHFPLSSQTTMLAAYWADCTLDLNRGTVYYRQVTTNSINGDQLLTRASNDIRQHFGNPANYQAKWLFIVTWHNVTYSGGTSTTPVNTFQAVLVSNNVITFALYNYGDLKWTTGSSSGGQDGLGPIQAQAGYNSGSPDFFFEVPMAMTAQILQLSTTSNVNLVGRWAFRTGQAENALGCYTDGLNQCNYAYQKHDLVTGECRGVAPAFNCPIFEGPTVINRQWFEFYCTVDTSETDLNARFEVVFLFNGLPAADVPPFIATVDNKTAVLHEQYISGKTGQSLSCRIVSYWDTTTNVRSTSLISKDYFLGILAPNKYFSVNELDWEFHEIVLKSTLPVTCQDATSASSPDPCELEISIVTSSDIAVRQRFPGRVPRPLRYIFKETDWKNDEKLAYNANTPLEVVAKADSFITAPRENRLQFHFAQKSFKQFKGSTYPNPWNNYNAPEIVGFHQDSPGSLAICTSNADPHFVSFDGLAYDSHGRNSFIYATSTVNPFEIQVRQQPCGAGSPVTCACGVAIREDDVALILNFCADAPSANPEKIFGCKKGDTCGILTDPAKLNYVLQVRSGSSVQGRLYGSNNFKYLNVQVRIIGRQKIEGLCGSPDGNRDNECKVRNTDRILPLENGRYVPVAVSDSWRVPDTPDEHMFRADYRPPDAMDPAAMRNVLTYCQSADDLSAICGGPAIGFLKFPNDPNIPSSLSSDTMETPLRGRRKTTGTSSRLAKEGSDNFEPFLHSFTNISEAEANSTCWRLIVNEETLGSSCMEFVAQNPDITEQIVQMCTDDVQLTGSFDWAYDKVASLQAACVIEVMTRNNSEINDTRSAMELVDEETGPITSHICVPYDCNGHGQCINGTCNCNTDYIGSDCAINKNAVPTIVDLIAPNCDLRSEDCASIYVTTLNAAGVSTLTCRITTLMSNGLNQMFTVPAILTTPTLVQCSLSPEQLVYNSFALNFTSLHEPGFDFNCLFRGSPVIEYAVSISNDGRSFSEEKSSRIFDSLCIDCNDNGCINKQDTCLINGYCFNNGQPNPYLPSCELCNPAVSNTSWTNTPSDENVDFCGTQQVCAPGYRCNPLPNFNFTCFEDYTSPPTTATESERITTQVTPPTYPQIPNPFMEIELEGEMYASYSLSLSCANSYSRQFNDILKGQLQRAKQEMLATPTFCPDTTNADLTAAYTNMVAVDSEVYLRFGVDIVSYGANTLGAMSSCAWQLGAYLSNFNNWRQPIWSDIFNCPRLTFINYGFNQTDITWIC